MTSPQTIDDVAPEIRARLHTLRTQQTQVRAVLADLRTVTGDDPFFSVSVSEREEAQNADRVLTGEIDLDERTLRDEVRAWRTDRNAQLCADLRPEMTEAIKLLERADAVLSRARRKVAIHQEQTGSNWTPDLPFGNLGTALPAIKAALRAEGLL